MSIEIKIPEVGESIREVLIGKWLHKEGDPVAVDEGLVELETDKASMDLPAPKAGVLGKILKREGESVAVGEVVAYLEEQRAEASDDADEPPSAEAADEHPEHKESRPDKAQDDADQHGAPRADGAADDADAPSAGAKPATPAARRALREHGLTAADISTAEPRIRPEHVLRHVERHNEPRRPRTHAESDAAHEELVPMSLVRRRIAERLVEAQHQAALLTTFNEVDMSAVKRLRATHGERFQQQHGVKLGFLSFFVKAVVDALRHTPALNAEVRGDQIAYRNYYHIGVAISAPKGLVVPVLRHAERLGFADIERAIGDFADRAQINKLGPAELSGGTFTISNGGVFGSLLSTPIVNPPQSGVLGMHAIEDRPVARNGEVVIRPMMYVALTYDHRIVDGREAVTFLGRVKEAIEDPARMLIEV